MTTTSRACTPLRADDRRAPAASCRACAKCPRPMPGRSPKPQSHRRRFVRQRKLVHSEGEGRRYDFVADSKTTVSARVLEPRRRWPKRGKLRSRTRARGRHGQRDVSDMAARRARARPDHDQEDVRVCCVSFRTPNGRKDTPTYCERASRSSRTPRQFFRYHPTGPATRPAPRAACQTPAGSDSASPLAR